MGKIDTSTREVTIATKDAIDIVTPAFIDECVKKGNIVNPSNFKPHIPNKRPRHERTKDAEESISTSTSTTSQGTTRAFLVAFEENNRWREDMERKILALQQAQQQQSQTPSLPQPSGEDTSPSPAVRLPDRTTDRQRFAVLRVCFQIKLLYGGKPQDVISSVFNQLFTISPNQLASEKKRNQHLLRKHFQTWRKSGVGKLVRELQAQYMAEDGSDLEFREQTADEKAKHLHRIKLTQAQQTIFWRVTSPWVEERGGGKQNSKIEGLT